MYFEKSKSKLEADNAAIYFLGLFQKRWEINECRQQIQTTAWASGRTWCAAQ